MLVDVGRIARLNGSLRITLDDMVFEVPARNIDRLVWNNDEVPVSRIFGKQSVVCGSMWPGRTRADGTPSAGMVFKLVYFPDRRFTVSRKELHRVWRGDGQVEATVAEILPDNVAAGEVAE